MNIVCWRKKIGGKWRRSFAGAWIEIPPTPRSARAFICRSFAGAWIEISQNNYVVEAVKVAPSRERGLKSHREDTPTPSHSRSFAGAWIEISQNNYVVEAVKVAPSRERGLKSHREDTPTPSHSRSFAGAWIEILYVQDVCRSPMSLLRGSVD